MSMTEFVYPFPGAAFPADSSLYPGAPFTTDPSFAYHLPSGLSDFRLLASGAPFASRTGSIYGLTHGSETMSRQVLFSTSGFCPVSGFILQFPVPTSPILDLSVQTTTRATDDVTVPLDDDAVPTKFEQETKNEPQEDDVYDDEDDDDRDLGEDEEEAEEEEEEMKTMKLDEAMDPEKTQDCPLDLSMRSGERRSSQSSFKKTILSRYSKCLFAFSIMPLF